MRTLEELLDMIPKYINGQLNEPDRLEFEAGLRRHPILKRETDELCEMKKGLVIADKYDEEHIDVDRLIVLAFNPGALPNPEQGLIHSHLEACAHCREMFELAQSSHRVVSKESNSILKSLKRLLVPPEIILRPAVAYAVLAICLIPALLLFSSYQRGGAGIQVVELHEGAERGISQPNSFSMIDGDTKIIRLQFLLPVRTDCKYDTKLLDQSGNTILNWPLLPPKSPFVLDVPSSSLPARKYLLAIDELDGSGNQIERFEIEFTIQIKD